MRLATPIIFLEFNELSAELIFEFMSQGFLPGFRRLYERSTVFTTDANESAENLEPWIQWPSIHSGMAFSEHRVYSLGDGHKLREKCLAEILSDAGMAVGVFGSMNINYRSLNGYVIPDPWRKFGKAFPESLQLFNEFVAKQVQESSRSDALSLRDLARFGFFMLQNGLSFETAKAVTSQLTSERSDSGVKWRRASLLDFLQYDLFRQLNNKHRIQFATFFSNSTAHYQHYYWRNMKPGIFDVGPPEGDHESLTGAILYGYESMDRIISRAFTDYPGGTIVLCTALSQKAWTNTTKCTFRPIKFEPLLSFAKIHPQSVKVEPVMAEQFHLKFNSNETLQQGYEALRDLWVEGRPLMRMREEGDKTLFCGCDINDARLIDGIVTRRFDGATIPFKELFYLIHTMRSGHHDSSGVFWVGNGCHQVIEEQVSIVDIAPTILAALGVEKPGHMKGSVLSACLQS